MVNEIRPWKFSKRQPLRMNIHNRFFSKFLRDLKLFSTAQRGQGGEIPPRPPACTSLVIAVLVFNQFYTMSVNQSIDQKTSEKPKFILHRMEIKTMDREMSNVLWKTQIVHFKIPSYNENRKTNISVETDFYLPYEEQSWFVLLFNILLWIVKIFISCCFEKKEIPPYIEVETRKPATISYIVYFDVFGNSCQHIHWNRLFHQQRTVFLKFK